ncbi:hypothetical protein AB6A40_009158 [Gnathostoma spinigerum]|uniref:Uncharacterized protein n=1 Tax=Gnathostoma spinigerum TaxID=75299 RepID=A0ABD6EW85_9BILA
MNEPITLVTRSTFVCFGTIQCGVIKPTNMTLEHLNVNVRDEVTSQRIALQIAFKHIIKVMVASYGNLVGIVILVNNFCARRIRETFQISQEPNVLLAANVPYFHPESCRICQRYIIVDMNDCQVPQLMTFFKLVEKRRLEIVADLNRRRGETGDYDTDCFLSMSHFSCTIKHLPFHLH